MALKERDIFLNRQDNSTAYCGLEPTPIKFTVLVLTCQPFTGILCMNLISVVDPDPDPHGSGFS